MFSGTNSSESAHFSLTSSSVSEVAYLNFNRKCSMWDSNRGNENNTVYPQDKTVSGAKIEKNAMLIS